MAFTFDTDQDEATRDLRQQWDDAAASQTPVIDDRTAGLSEADVRGSDAVREVVFIDGPIANLEGLLSAIKPEVERVVIQP